MNRKCEFFRTEKIKIFFIFLLFIFSNIAMYSEPVKQVPVENKNWTVSELDLEMVYVEKGSFNMGSNEGSDNEKPVHEVTITRGFWIGKYEVTQKQYKKLIGNNPSSLKNLDNPVERISWYNADAFCKKLTEQERKNGRLPDGYVYRLPTEAEWEYAARGGQKSKGFKFSGSDTLSEVGWYEANNKYRIQPVGSKKPNELGIHDMSGNLWEWCYDWYWREYYSMSPDEDPQGKPTGYNRVKRGGSWLMAARECRLTDRFFTSPDSTYCANGFRICLARELISEEK